MSKYILHPLGSNDTQEVELEISDNQIFKSGPKPLLLIDGTFYIQDRDHLHEVATTNKSVEIDLVRMAQVIAPDIDDALSVLLPDLFPKDPEQFTEWFKAVYRGIDNLNGDSVTLRALRAIQLGQTDLPDFVSDEEIQKELIPFLESVTSDSET